MNNCAFVGVVLCRRWKIALSAQTAGVHSQISRNELVSCYRSFWGVVRNIFGARMRLYNRVNMSFFVRMRFYFFCSLHRPSLVLLLVLLHAGDLSREPRACRRRRT
jgi:hypothetical protein